MSTRLRRSSLLLVLILFIANLAAGQAAKQAQAAAAKSQPAGPQRVTSVEGITEYRLANGLEVLLFPDPTKPTITVNVTYLVGSAREGYGETGMAHLLEHMVFKGTPNHRNVPQELNAHGARFNGSTSFDRTNYYETIQATDENLKWALAMEADRMVNSFIAKKDLDSEMTVVRNEFERGENSAQRVLEERLFSTAYLWHNYGKSTIGARSDIESVPIERLRAFYRKYYQPDDAVLLIAGKFDEAKTLALVNQTLGKIPAPKRKLDMIYTIEPTQDGERSVTLRRVGDVQVVMAGYHVPAGSHADFAAVQVLMWVLGNAPSGRLYKALVDSKKATSVSAFAMQLRDPGLALFSGNVRAEASLDAARDEMLKTIQAAIANPPTKEEVDRARQALVRNIEMSLNSSDRVGLQMSEWVSKGDWRLLFLHRDRLRKVTPEDVQRVAAAYLRPSNLTVGLFLPTPNPERAEIPAVPDLAAVLKNYKGEAAVAAGEAFDPAPANIEARVKRAQLPNGIKVALLPLKTRGNTVNVSMTFRYGDEKSLMNRSTEASFAGQMLMRGTTKHTREQLRDEFDKLKARVTVGGGGGGMRGGGGRGGPAPSSGPGEVAASAETTRENLPAVLALVAEILRQPAFPEKEFEQLKQERLAAIEAMKSEPQMIASNALQRHLSPYSKGDVRYVATTEERLEETKATTLEGVKKFHADFFGASNAQIAVLGEFDQKEITPLLTELFGSWKSARPFSRVVARYKDAPALNKSFETPDKANAQFVAGLSINISDDDPDYAALVLGNYMLGGNTLNSRLGNRIRQKEGLSYGVTSSFSANSLDKVASFSSTAICAPQNMARLETAFQEEVARALKDGFTADEVKAAKSGWLQGRQLLRSQDSGLATMLSNYLFLNRTFKRDAELEKKVAELTPEQIQAAMRRHLDPAKISIVKAGDFAKK